MTWPVCAKGRELCLTRVTHYHVHKYGRGRKRNVCTRCGTRRRYDGANWQRMEPFGRWTSTNPTCVPSAPPTGEKP